MCGRKVKEEEEKRCKNEGETEKRWKSKEEEEICVEGN